MSDVTQILNAIDGGDPQAAAQLLPLVYDELRKLAAAQMAREKPGQTLDATALVHEAYLRLVPGRASSREADVGAQSTSGLPLDARHEFANRRHFFAAAAEAMRRILVESARRKGALKHGGKHKREALPTDGPAVASSSVDVLAMNELLDKLAVKSPRKAELVKLRYFMGCTMAEAAQILGIALKTAEEDWTYAKAWLRRQWLRDEQE